MKVELSHDALAKSIFNKASSDDKRLLKISFFIKERNTHYTETQTLLTQEDLDYIAPYTARIPLTSNELIFITKSKTQLKKAKKLWFTAIIIANVIFIGFIIYMQISNATLENNKNEIAQSTAKIEDEEFYKILAEKRADSLLSMKSKMPLGQHWNDSNYAQILISSYDTLQKINENLTKERNLAQSATLSSLANEALQQDDKNYAFQLAAKAWQLNKENKQACKVLYAISEVQAYEEAEEEEEAADELISDDDDEQDIILIEEVIEEVGAEAKDYEINNSPEPEPYSQTTIKTKSRKKIIAKKPVKPKRRKKRKKILIEDIIHNQRSKKGRTDLSEKDMKTIFNQNNRIVSKKKQGVHHILNNSTKTN